jgi:tetratricopeptide (TPR) repeat protein
MEVILMSGSALTLRFLTILLALTLMGGCALRSVRMNQKAQVYIQFGEYEKARNILIDSFKINHENPASHYWLGHCYEQTGQMEKAIYEYGLAVRFDPAMHLAQVSYIKALYRANQIDQAYIATQKYLEHKEVPVRDTIGLAEDFVSEDMFDLARMCYTQAQKNEPDNARPSVEIADFYFAQGQQHSAIEYLKQAFRIDPLYPGLARQLGSHGHRVDIPQPRIHPLPPSPLSQKLDAMEL